MLTRRSFYDPAFGDSWSKYLEKKRRNLKIRQTNVSIFLRNLPMRFLSYESKKQKLFIIFVRTISGGDRFSKHVATFGAIT